MDCRQCAATFLVPDGERMPRGCLCPSCRGSQTPRANLELTCVDCSGRFTWRRDEQRRFTELGLQPPRRCADCREKRRHGELPAPLTDGQRVRGRVRDVFGGYGFIEVEGYTRSLFFSFTDVDGSDPLALKIGDILEADAFNTSKGPRGLRVTLIERIA